MSLLTLTRKFGEAIRIRMGDSVMWIRVVRIDRNQVRLQFEGDAEVVREELLEEGVAKDVGRAFISRPSEKP